MKVLTIGPQISISLVWILLLPEKDHIYEALKYLYYIKKDLHQ